MAITANDIRTVTFSKPPIGKRGYNEDEVDAFLDLLEVEVDQKDQELEELNRQLADNRVAVPVLEVAPQPPPVRLEPVPETASVQAARILEMAERTADQVAREAEELSERAIREAKDKAADIMGEARYEASKLVDGARKEAADIEVRLAELREFEKNYTGRLESYMESQLAALRADRQV